MKLDRVSMSGQEVFAQQQDRVKSPKSGHTLEDHTKSNVQIHRG